MASLFFRCLLSPPSASSPPNRLSSPLPELPRWGNHRLSRDVLRGCGWAGSTSSYQTNMPRALPHTHVKIDSSFSGQDPVHGKWDAPSHLGLWGVVWKPVLLVGSHTATSYTSTTIRIVGRIHRRCPPPTSSTLLLLLLSYSLILAVSASVLPSS